MSLPLRLRACMPLGRTSSPELRLQLLQLRLGAGVGAGGVRTRGGEVEGGGEGGGGRGGGTGASTCGNVSNSSRGGVDSSVDSSSGNDSVKERRRWWRRLGRGMRQLPGSCQAAAWWWPYGGWDVAHAAGALLLLHVMLPDQVCVGRSVGGSGSGESVCCGGGTSCCQTRCSWAEAWGKVWTGLRERRAACPATSSSHSLTHLLSNCVV